MPNIGTSAYLYGDEGVFTGIINIEDIQIVFLGPVDSLQKIYFPEYDWVGDVFVTGGKLVWDSDSDTLYYPAERLTDQVLMKSYRTTVSANRDGTLRSTGSCVNEDSVSTALWVGAVFTPAQEVLNAVYPMRLEQLP